MLALTGFHNWFKTSIHKWLQIVHERSTERIRKAVEMDPVSFWPNQKQRLYSLKMLGCVNPMLGQIWAIPTFGMKM